MYSQWLKTEHDRLHIVEEWPDGPNKTAALKAIRSAICSLTRIAPIPLKCEVCLNRSRHGIVRFPALAPLADDSSTTLAA